MISDETFDAEGDLASKSEAPKVTGQPNDEQKREVARWVAEGMGLSDIQKKINDDFGVAMTYMEVRFLVDDLDLTLVDEEEPVEEGEMKATARPGFPLKHLCRRMPGQRGYKSNSIQ